MRDCSQSLRKRIAHLEAELRAVKKQAQAQRQRIAQKCGHEFLVSVDHPNTRVTVFDIVQKVLFQDEKGNVISEADLSLVGKLIEVRFGLLPSCNEEK